MNSPSFHFDATYRTDENHRIEQISELRFRQFILYIL